MLSSSNASPGSIGMIWKTGRIAPDAMRSLRMLAFWQSTPSASPRSTASTASLMPG